VASSTGAADPLMPCVAEPMKGDADAILPASILSRSSALMPPAPTARRSSWRSSPGCSRFEASDVPPCAYREQHWSFLKSVGFSQASTPFEKRTTVTPSSAISRRDTTVAGVGGFSTSGRSVTASFHGVTATRSAAARAARRSASCGAFTESFSGSTARMTSPSPPSRWVASVVTSCSVIVGSTCCTSRHSYSMPGLGSWFRK
jgi:hypothetical protein